MREVRGKRGRPATILGEQPREQIMPEHLEEVLADHFQQAVNVAMQGPCQQ